MYVRRDIQKYKEEYFAIKFVYCSVLNKKIHFNSSGFVHLIRKGRKFRTIPERKRRLSLLKYIIKVLEYGHVEEIRIFQKGNFEITYWSIAYIVRNKKINIILRRIGKQKVHFYSIFDR